MLKLLRTTTFKLALWHLGIFGASAFALLFFIYWSTVGFMERQTEETLQKEIQGLQEQYRQRGLPGLTRLIIERSGREGPDLYYLQSPLGPRIAGNLSRLPPGLETQEGWVDFTYKRPSAEAGEEAEERAARAWRGRVRGGYWLLVGRDVDELYAVQERIRAAIGWAALITLALGIAGGIVMSRNMMQRLDGVNRTSAKIMDGDLTQRIAVTGSGDELDQLSVNLNKMLDQIERLMSAMREVSDNVAHDLRSPLTRLKGRVDMALRSAASETDYRAALEDANREADRLLGVFNALLSIARLESGAAAVELKELRLGDVAAEVADLYEPLAAEAGFHLTLQVAGAPPVRASRELVSQALSNLLDNALKYAGGGRLVISVDSQGEMVRLAVRDEGPGVPDKDRQRVLARFVRLEESRSEPGSGLGLAMVSAVMALHQGRIELAEGGLQPPTLAPGLAVCLYFPAVFGK